MSGESTLPLGIEFVVFFLGGATDELMKGVARRTRAGVEVAANDRWQVIRVGEATLMNGRQKLVDLTKPGASRTEIEVEIDHVNLDVVDEEAGLEKSFFSQFFGSEGCDFPVLDSVFREECVSISERFPPVALVVDAMQGDWVFGGGL